MFTDIQEAIKWLIKRRNSNYSFEHFKEVCHKIGDPQNHLYQIHVAGTDGKGSTVSYLAALLRSQGYKVGTFTSPHYLTHLDRIRIDDVPIPEDIFLSILNEGLPFYLENDLSMFEIDYLIMCRYFKESRVDVAVVETGLGGRLDSTNVVDNTKLSIITTIGYDHMDRLGNTLAEICREKCGIIKDDSRILIGHLDEECRKIVEDCASQHHSVFYELGDYTDLGDRRFRFHDREFQLNSYASYQIHNASLALYALEIISKDLRFQIDYSKAKEALSSAVWHGRFEIVKEKPRVIIDGAHNIHGVEALVQSFDRFTGSKCIVFSALKRKDFHPMSEMLKEHCDRLVITTFDNKEAISHEDLLQYDYDPSYEHAIDEAIKNYDNILICGSLYFLSDVVSNYKF
ncbi:MAG: bifunctional folylpolyglutamate synthase/dihydrofolate synthase [Erysipelotrichaceae bacterium]|nr:bifunctional folylpolyglutamate synthase/dihydrofolate synthase [Erysipelotrichaceae bacterium]